MRKPRRSISSALCRLRYSPARQQHEQVPDAQQANRASTPNLKLDVTHKGHLFRAGNLNATAQRGARATKPSRPAVPVS